MSILSKLAMSLALAGAAAAAAPSVADACGGPYSSPQWTEKDAVHQAALAGAARGPHDSVQAVVLWVGGAHAEVEVRWIRDDHELVQRRLLLLTYEAGPLSAAAWEVSAATARVRVARGAPFPADRASRFKSTKRAAARAKPARAPR
jgi:hypothetical protein